MPEENKKKMILGEKWKMKRKKVSKKKMVLKNKQKMAFIKALLLLIHMELKKCKGNYNKIKI